MLIDAHQHYWDPAAVAYPWMDPADAVLHRRYGPEDLAPHLERHGIDGTVLVQSADSDADTDSMLAIATAHHHVWGVVGYVPLEDPDRLVARLDTLRSEPLFCGVRNLIHDRPDPDWLLLPEVVEGLRRLERADIPFDLVAVIPRHLEVLLRLRDLLPDLRIVIDHFGKPPFGADDDHPWYGLIMSAAARDGVVAKLSGLYPTLAGAEADLRPWFDRALELFGPDRLMLGSDWPIAELAGGFDPTWESLIATLEEYDDDTVARLRSGTALDFYGLSPRSEAAR